MEQTTPRLVLREFRQEDLEALCDCETDSETQRYEHVPPLNREEVKTRLQNWIDQQQAVPRKMFDMAITLPAGGCVIGHLSLHLIAAHIREWEIGWEMNRQYWGKGFASEAAQAVLRMAFEELNAHRVVAFCHVNNAASVRVMEKIGMQFEGRLREVRWLNERWYNENVYSILEKDFCVPK
jgi:RimJ/RimL family protein N-acetyltransferase